MKRAFQMVGSGLVLFSLAFLLYQSGWLDTEKSRVALGGVIHESRSDFSHIRVRDRDGVRSLLFVDKSGKEQRQSAIDLASPHELQLGYTRTLFASLLFDEAHERVLIVGLGGGGMVRFINHVLPETQVDVVEIDPAVVEVADKFFETRSGPKTTIHTEDAFVYLKEPHGPCDVIYMDAFLQPPANSGLEEKTIRLKAVEFLRSLHARLKPDGMVAFNLVRYAASTPDDKEAIREAFPAVFEFGVPGTGNLVVIGSLETESPTREALLARADELDAKLETGFSFRAIVEAMAE